MAGFGVKLREGTRKCPARFLQRIREAFPREEMHVVWNDVARMWQYYRRSPVTRLWQFIMEWPRDPSEETLKLLREGYVGQGIPDVHDRVDRYLRNEEKIESKRTAEWKEDLATRMKSWQYYLKSAITGELPLNPRYTHGWSGGA